MGVNKALFKGSHGAHHVAFTGFHAHCPIISNTFISQVNNQTGTTIREYTVPLVIVHSAFQFPEGMYIWSKCDAGFDCLVFHGGQKYDDFRSFVFIIDTSVYGDRQHIMINEAAISFAV